MNHYVRRGGGSRSSSSSGSSSSSSSGSSGSGDAGPLIDLLIFLMEISMFFRYGILFGLLILLVMFVEAVTIGWFQEAFVFHLVVWIAIALFGLYLDIMEIISSVRYRKAGINGELADLNVNAISGIGPKRAKKLHKIEIYSLGDLAMSDVEILVNAGFNKKLASRFISEAQSKTGISPDKVEKEKA